MWAKLQSGCVQGLKANIVTVEADLQSGLPSFCIVGLPDTSVRESKERVRSALKNAQLSFPMKRITVNLAPAHLKKGGSSFELALALVLLMADEQWDFSAFHQSLFLGELSLKGELNPIRGILPLVLEAKRKKFTSVFVPLKNAQEAAMVKGIRVYGIKDLNEIVSFLKKEIDLTPINFSPDESVMVNSVDFSEVKGQRWAKRAMEVAAAGGHHLMMVGTPGCGKSMLAKRLPTILPPLSFDESLAVTQIYSVSGLLMNDRHCVSHRPFRSPHHTVSYSAMVGGGAQRVMPGEISLAHKGVLFLDEMPEFRRDVLEVLRQPLEDRQVSISRVQGRFTYPADFMLAAAMNPCPCGYFGDKQKDCICTEVQVQKYQQKVSGPLLDRIDMHVYVPKISLEESRQSSDGSSSEMRERVNHARGLQTKRYTKTPFSVNAQMSASAITEYCHLRPDAETFLNKTLESMGFSYRTYHRILKLSRTLADLAGEEKISVGNVAEAIQLRFLDG